jgi:hypothetical protein
VTAVAGPDGASGTVYTISNAAAGNELVTYSRSADGSLTPAGAVSAGGLGTGGGLASQGAVGLLHPRRRQWLDLCAGRAVARPPSDRGAGRFLVTE